MYVFGNREYLTCPATKSNTKQVELFLFVSHRPWQTGQVLHCLLRKRHMQQTYISFATDCTLLALAYLGNTAQIGNLFVSCHPVWWMQVQYGLSTKRYVSAACIAGNGQYLTCPGWLGQHNTDLVISICVTSLKKTQASTVLSVAKGIHAMDLYLFVTCSSVLVLATLDNVTQIGSFLFVECG
jgi:hypothetical protein